MSNQKGNQYPIWFITNNYQVFAGDSNGAAHQMSNQLFAMDVVVSEDGTVWVLSTEPDPDGGGAKLFWGNGDGKWTEINTPDPGGVQIAGGPGNTCLFLDSNRVLRSMDTSGGMKIIDNSGNIIEMDYGGAYLWALNLNQEGIPVLQLSPFQPGQALNFQSFAKNPQPYSLSVSYSGDCYAIDNFSPMYYSNDGSKTGSAGAGADGKALQISFKNWAYLVSTDVGSDLDNIIKKWIDTQGGVFENTSFEGIRVASSYYR